MKPMRMTYVLVLILAAAVAAATIPDPRPGPGPDAGGAPASAETDPVAVFGEGGTLQRPRGYRRWIFVGSPLTPDELNDGHAAFPEFHSVYVDPDSYDHYKLNGKWRDGTVILKELSSVGSKAATSGRGYFQGEYQGLEALVKSAARFPDEPGHWGFFRFTDETGGPNRERAELLPTESCAVCHQAAADEDLVFTQYYPVLRAARGHGRGEPEDA